MTTDIRATKGRELVLLVGNQDPPRGAKKTNRPRWREPAPPPEPLGKFRGAICIGKM